MNAPTLFGLCGAVLVGLGLYGLVVNPQPLRKILAFNLVGSGVFLLFGVVARRGAALGMGGDPVPQALVITGIVVAFSATALAVALVLRLHDMTGAATLAPADADEPPRHLFHALALCERRPVGDRAAVQHTLVQALVRSQDGPTLLISSSTNQALREMFPAVDQILTPYTHEDLFDAAGSRLSA